MINITDEQKRIANLLSDKWYDLLSEMDKYPPEAFQIRKYASGWGFNIIALEKLVPRLNKGDYVMFQGVRCRIARVLENGLIDIIGPNFNLQVLASNLTVITNARSTFWDKVKWFFKIR